jgi:acyl-CoA thioesterase FadM
MQMSTADGLPDPARIVLRRRIEWMDTDAAGIYHYTTVLRLAEAAEAALCTSLGIADRMFGFLPRVGLALEFRRPLRFNDPVELELSVAGVSRSTVRYALTLTGPDGLAAQGTISGCLIDGESKRAVRWPHDMRQLLSGGGRQPDAV